MSDNEFFRQVKVEDVDFADSFDGVMGVINRKANYFECDVIRQRDLVGEEFWVIDYIDNVQTQYSREKGNGEGKMIVLIATRKDADKREEFRKFFTGSSIIRKTMEELKSIGKLPLLVKMYRNDNKYSFGPVGLENPDKKDGKNSPDNADKTSSEKMSA